jgi:opacity protein-like surface antigen
MSKSLSSLAAVLSMLTATPVVAYDDGGRACDYCELFPYKPLRVQLEGGRTITQNWAAQYLDNGMSAGLGITWQPSQAVPLALRADGVYQSFDARPLLISQAASHFGTPVDEGEVRMWGGDLDAELDLRLSSGSRMYLLAGVGWYDEQNSFYEQGALVTRNTTGVHFARNAGLGLEFGNGGTVSLFLDARYLRLEANGHNLDLIPIRVGLRF